MINMLWENRAKKEIKSILNKKKKGLLDLKKKDFYKSLRDPKEKINLNIKVNLDCKLKQTICTEVTANRDDICLDIDTRTILKDCKNLKDIERNVKKYIKEFLKNYSPSLTDYVIGSNKKILETDFKYDKEDLEITIKKVMSYIKKTDWKGIDNV